MSAWRLTAGVLLLLASAVLAQQPAQQNPDCMGCDAHAVCNVLGPEVSCACNSGYTGDGDTCTSTDKATALTAGATTDPSLPLTTTGAGAGAALLSIAAQGEAAAASAATPAGANATDTELSATATAAAAAVSATSAGTRTKGVLAGKSRAGAAGSGKTDDDDDDDGNMERQESGSSSDGWPAASASAQQLKGLVGKKGTSTPGSITKPSNVNAALLPAAGAGLAGAGAKPKRRAGAGREDEYDDDDEDADDDDKTGGGGSDDDRGADDARSGDRGDEQDDEAGGTSAMVKAIADGRKRLLRTEAKMKLKHEKAEADAAKLRRSLALAKKDLALKSKDEKRESAGEAKLAAALDKLNKRRADLSSKLSAERSKVSSLKAKEEDDRQVVKADVAGIEGDRRADTFALKNIARIEEVRSSQADGFISGAGGAKVKAVAAQSAASVLRLKTHIAAANDVLSPGDLAASGGATSGSKDTDTALSDADLGIADLDGTKLASSNKQRRAKLSSQAAAGADANSPLMQALSSSSGLDSLDNLRPDVKGGGPPLKLDVRSLNDVLGPEGAAGTSNGGGPPVGASLGLGGPGGNGLTSDINAAAGGPLPTPPSLPSLPDASNAPPAQMGQLGGAAGAAAPGVLAAAGTGMDASTTWGTTPIASLDSMGAEAKRYDTKSLGGAWPTSVPAIHGQSMPVPDLPPAGGLNPSAGAMPSAAVANMMPPVGLVAPPGGGAGVSGALSVPAGQAPVMLGLGGGASELMSLGKPAGMSAGPGENVPSISLPAGLTSEVHADSPTALQQAGEKANMLGMEAAPAH